MNSTDNTTHAEEAAAVQAQQVVGQLLRETRKKAGFEIDEVARVLRISQRYLEALEDGRNQDLPGTTYAIGFVRSYAEHLKLDGEEIVRRYKAEAEVGGVRSNLIFPKPIPDSGVPGGAVLGLGLIVAAAAYGIWYWKSNADTVQMARVDSVPEHMAAPDQPAPGPVGDANAQIAATPAEPGAAPSDEPNAEPAPPSQDAAGTPEGAVVAEVDGAPQVADPSAAAPAVDEAPAVEVPAVAAPQQTAPAEAPQDEQPAAEPASESTAVEPAPMPAPQAQPAAQAEPAAQVDPAAPAPQAAAPASEPAPAEPVQQGASRITVRAKSNSWIQIRDEELDRLLFTRLLREGDEYEVPNREGLRLMTGNAGALELMVDGKAVPAIGEAGEVRRNVELDPEKLKAGTAVSE